jgi:hypothetical protein
MGLAQNDLARESERETEDTIRGMTGNAHRDHACHGHHVWHPTRNHLLHHCLFFPSSLIIRAPKLQFMLTVCEIASITIRASAGVVPLNAKTSLAIPWRSIRPSVICHPVFAVPSPVNHRQNIW